MFIKKLLVGERAPDAGFWRSYEADVQAFSIDGKGERRAVFKSQGSVLFSGNKSDPWRYDLVLRSGSPKEEPYFFPLKADWRPVYEVRKDDVVFTFQVQPELKVEIVFPALQEDYATAARFRQILGRLLYQVEHRTSFQSNANIDEEINRRVTPQAPDVSREPTPALLAALAKLEKDDECLLAGVGRFSSVNPSVPTEEPKLIAAQAILSIYRREKFTYELRIVDEGGKTLYSKEVGQGLHYYADESRNSMTWVDTRNNGIVCLNFGLAGGEVGAVRRLLAACALECERRMDIEEIRGEKSDWDKFYLAAADPAERDQPQIQAFRQQRTELNYGESRKTPAEEVEKDAIRGFAQGKAKNLCFVTRNSGIEVYRFRRDSAESLGVECAGLLKPSDADPLAALPLQQDTRLAAVDGKKRERAVVLDAESGKVVSEWQAAAPLNDLGYFHGKAQPLGEASTFVAVTDCDIYAVDPRTKEGTVQHHHYKTDYGFQKIIAADEHKLAVSSRNGDLRLYSAVGDKAAKNLIPAFAPAGALGLDVTKDGALLLVTYPKYLLLIITLQEGKSAFSTTFRKDAKPRPIVLTVAPEAMARHALTDISFTSGRFDEKADSEESFIVAAASPFLALWSLAKVLRGQTVCQNVKRMEDNVIKGEFKYNENDLVAAFRDHLCIQPTKEK